MQTAALAMIAASRAVLDAMETLVRDPATAAQATATVGHMAKALVEVVADAARSRATPSGGVDDVEIERIEVN